MTHICVSKLSIIGSVNSLSPGRRQAIIWTNAGILLIGPLGTNFNENSIDIRTFSFKKMHLKMSSETWRPFSPGPKVLKANGSISREVLFNWIAKQYHRYHSIFMWNVSWHSRVSIAVSLRIFQLWNKVMADKFEYLLTYPRWSNFCTVIFLFFRFYIHVICHKSCSSNCEMFA